MEILKLNERDLNRFIELIELFGDVFEMKEFKKSSDEYLKNLLCKKDFMVFVAVRENHVIGGLTAYSLDQYYSDRPLAYIYDLAVSKSYQRQGVGKNLIKSFKDFCLENGFEEIFVQADKVDSYALDFYRQTNITGEEQVVHFTYALS